MKKQLKMLLVDFDGVMSNSRFYNSEIAAEKEMARSAVQTIFTAENSELLNDWMRGKVGYQDIHNLVEQKTGVKAEDLDRLLEDSVKRMSINRPMLAFIGKLRKKGVIVSLFTNNMDIFDSVSRRHYELDNHFDFIYSSSEYGQLKLENDTLLNRALHDAKTTKSEVAFVDDSQASYDAATSFGVSTFLYKDYLDSQVVFEAWVEKRYQF